MKSINKLFCLCVLFSLSFSQFDWEDNGIAIRQGYHIEWQRTADIGDDGSVIFAWSDTRDGGRDIYAKKIDANGSELWNSNGQLVVSAPGRQEDPQLVNDGNGGAYIIWKDYRDEPDDGDFYAQHILSDGSLAWNETGVSLTSVPGKQTSPNLCVDGQGGAFAIWKDESSGSGVPPVYGTHLGPNEEDIINPGVGVLLISSDLNFGGVSIEVSSVGSAILTWAYKDENDQEDLYAQRIDSECNLLWPSSGEPSNSGIPISIEEGNQSFPRVTYYNEEVSVIVWEDDRFGNDDIYAQFINMDGSLIFNEDLLVCSASDRQYKPRVKADSEGAFVVWSDRRDSNFIDDNNHIYMQKISPDGLEWEQEIAVGIDSDDVEFGVDHKEPRLSSDGFGGAYIVWESNLSDQKYDIYFQHINTNGEIYFDSNGLAITSGNKTQEGPIVRPDFNEGAFILWGDYRTGSPGIYLQHISQSGQISLEEGGREMYWGIDGNTVSTYATKPTSHYIGANETIIGWSDQRFGAGEVINFGQKIYNNWENSEQKDGYELSKYLSYTDEGDLAGGHDFPIISTLGDNIIHFFPTQQNWGPYLRYQLLDHNLNILGDDQGQSVTQSGFPHFWDTFRFINASNGYGYLSFSEQIDFWSYNIMIQKYDFSGNPIFSSAINITPYSDSDKNVKDIHEIEGIGFFVVFQTESWLTGNYVKVIGFDYNGNLLPGWDESITVDNSGNNQTYQGSIVTSSGIFVAYVREIGSPTDLNGNGVIEPGDETNYIDSNIYGQMISTNGEILGDVAGIPLAVRDGKQQNASISYNELIEEIMICYEDRINYAYYDISCLPINESLNINDEVIIGNLSNVNQVEPYTYATLDGSYLVVWQDDRNYTGNIAGNEDIYLQQITNGEIIHQQNGIAVCNENYFPQKNPQIELYDESNNSYVIYWNDLRSSGKANFTNIYAQSITVSSGPLCNLGDINQDDVINVIDIVSLVNYILGAADFNSTQLCAADLNGDTIINVIDIVSLVNQILSI